MKAPNNIEAEQALLGSIMAHNDAFTETQTIVSKATFYEALHADIYEAMEKLALVGKKISPISLKSFLPESTSDGMPLLDYMMRLMSMAVTVLNSVDYATILRDLHSRRSLMSVADGMGYSASNDNSKPPSQMIEEAERGLYEIARSGEPERGFIAFKTALADAVNNAASAYQRGGGLVGISTGLTSLDRMMGGLQNSDLVVIAGRPGMGKTALATNMALSAARAGHKIGFFSLEMSAPQLALRILSDESNISSADIRRGEIHESQFAALVDASARIERLELSIDDTGGLTIPQLVSRARRFKRGKGMDLLVVDYLQLLGGSSRKDGNRVQEMTEITTSLKALAKELDIPVIALSQLSRAVEQREDKTPQLSDLRESGSIEQDADMVLFVYREEYYLRQNEPKEGSEEAHKWEALMQEHAGKATIIIGKQRHGPTGIVPVAFEGRRTKFGDLPE